MSPLDSFRRIKNKAYDAFIKYAISTTKEQKDDFEASLEKILDFDKLDQPLKIKNPNEYFFACDEAVYEFTEMKHIYVMSGFVNVYKNCHATVCDKGKVLIWDGGNAEVHDGGKADVLNGGNANVRHGGKVDVYGGGIAEVHDGGFANVWSDGLAYIHKGGKAEVWRGGNAYMHQGGAANAKAGSNASLPKEAIE